MSTTSLPIIDNTYIPNYPWEEDMSCIDGKYNQLQKDVYHLENSINQMNEKFDLQCKLYTEMLTHMTRLNRSCILQPHSNFMAIYNYSIKSVGILIGKRRHNIKTIENIFNVYVEIPEKSNQPYIPIKVFPKMGYSNYCAALIHIVDILNNN